MRQFCLVLVLAAASGCANKDWRQAVDANTGEAYRGFVTLNPDHYRADLAMERAEALDWSTAEAENTPTSYGVYLGAHPFGLHAGEARTLAQDLSWTEAVEAGSPEALSSYIARYPQSDRVPEARRLIEESWYNLAVREATEAAWGRYLVRYPQGRWRDEAKEEQQRLAWQELLIAPSRNGYERFMMRFPDSEHLTAAADWIEQSRVVTLQPVVVLGTSWQPAASRVAVVRRVRRGFDQGLVYDLGRDFRIKRTLMVDLNGGAAPHPQQAYGVEPDTGLLVLTYHESQGRRFQPSGHATDIEATLSLYAPPTSEPVWTVDLEASTPGRALGNTEDALHEAAVVELSGRLRTFADELAAERRGGL